MFSQIKKYDPLATYQDGEIVIAPVGNSLFLSVIQGNTMTESYLLFSSYVPPTTVELNPDYLDNFPISCLMMKDYILSLMTGPNNIGFDPYALPVLTTSFTVDVAEVLDIKAYVVTLKTAVNNLIQHLTNSFGYLIKLNLDQVLNNFINLRTYNVNPGYVIEVHTVLSNGNRSVKFIYYSGPDFNISSDDYFRYSVRNDVLFIESLTSDELTIKNVFVYEQ